MALMCALNNVIEAFDINEQDISVKIFKENIDNAITEIVKVFDIKRDKCLMLLQKYQWNITRLIHDYYNNPMNLHQLLQSIQYKHTQNNNNLICDICKNQTHITDVFKLECNCNDDKFICIKCWMNYLSNNIDTINCAELTCPLSNCNTIIPFSVWKLFLSQSQYQKYIKYHQLNFIDVKY